MKINHIGLANFRNHDLFNLDFQNSCTAIIGRNGLGKTNIVEAIYFASTLKSHRVATDPPLIKSGAEHAFIEVSAQKADRVARVSVTINRETTNTYEVNGAPVRKTKDVVGIIQTIIFSPEDLNLVKNEPVARRQFLDDFLVQQKPRLSEVKSDYDRVLKQRNTLLKSAAGRKLSDTAKSTLSAWDEQLVSLGSEIVFHRLQALIKLKPHITEFGNIISDTTEPINVSYQSNWLVDPEPDLGGIESQFREQLELRHSDEVARGVSLIGPHRDDVYLQLNGLPVRNFASHGQSWSVAIALRLATFQILREFETDPVLILDDIFAELDQNRRARLVKALIDVEQTIITVADTKDIPADLTASQFWLPDGLNHAHN